MNCRVEPACVSAVRRIAVIGKLAEKLAERFDEKHREPLWRHTAGFLLNRCFGDAGKGVAAFDWIERNSVICVEWVEVVIAMAKARGLGTVSLPHGDSPHYSQLIRRGERRVEPDVTFSAATIFEAATATSPASFASSDQSHGSRP